MFGWRVTHTALFRSVGRCVLVVVLLVWIFGGWPQISGWPPKVQFAQAAGLTYVGGASGSGTGATYSVSLTSLTGGSGSAAVAGDLVIVVTGWASTVNGDPGVTTAGYTEEPGSTDLYSSDTRDANISANWKVMGSTPDTSVTVRGFNNAANGGATVVQVWRGADQTTPMDVTVTTASANNQSASSPDSPSITPATSGVVVLSAGIGTDDTTPLTKTAPTGYGNTVTVTGTGSTMSVTAGIAAKAWSSGAENPAAWTGGETSTSDSWAAFSIAIRPAITTLGNGTDPANSTVAPGSSSNYLDQFTLVTTGYSDSITALTVTTTNTSAVASVQIWNDAMSTQYFATVSSPSGNNWSFSGGTPISVTTSSAAYRVVFTATSQGSLASGTYGVTANVTSFTSSNSQVGSDTAGTTITVDNTAPNSATSTSGTAGDASVTLNWTTSSSSDFSRSVVLRWASSSAGSEVPAEGTDYSAGNTITTATVACVRTGDAASTALSGIVDGTGGTAGCTTSALTNGQAYTYKVFQKDSYGNYDVGVSIGTFTPQASVVSVTITSDGTVAYGTLAAGASKSTIAAELNDTQTAKNDGNVSESFNIKTSNATGGTTWTLGSSAGSNVFVHEFSTNGGGAWTKFTTADSYQSLASGIATNGTKTFDLRVTVPTSSSDYVQKSITVTVQAVAP